MIDEKRISMLEAQLVKDRVMFENLYRQGELAPDWRLHCSLRVSEINDLLPESHTQWNSNPRDLIEAMPPIPPQA